MNTLFAKGILSVPTVSGKEDFFVEVIEKWCKLVGIKTHKDGKGNLYLEKGHAEWMPCLCSHLDTVHKKYLPYIEKRELLPVKIDGDRLYIEGMGVGADCKAGVAICLSVMKQVRCCKCVLFVEEEEGMLGSKALDKSFFDNVSYVLSWDSPGGNRATKTSARVPMFTDELFKIAEPIYKKHGVTNWNDEPWTDTVQIVKLTGTCCINAKNGGSMTCHTDREDASIKEMNDSEQLCLDAIAGIPCDRKWKIEYQEPPKPKYGGYFSTAQDYGKYVSPYSSAASLLKPLAADWPSSSDLTIDDIEQRDETEQCSLELSYDDDEQFEKHRELIEKEDVIVELDELDYTTMTAQVFGELQEVKKAYILWYQLFYDAPQIKTWEELKQDDDMSHFADSVVFVNDEDDDLDAIGDF